MAKYFLTFNISLTFEESHEGEDRFFQVLHWRTDYLWDHRACTDLLSDKDKKRPLPKCSGQGI